MNVSVATPSTLDAALDLAARGIPVFPCVGHPRSRDRKKPLTRRGFKDASTDPDTIKAWWEAHPNALIGMPTGKVSGIIVLDLDRKNGKDGFAVVPDWEMLSPTRVRTTNGGAHVYFAAEGYTPCSTGEDGVDVRGDGGYVIAPPSPGWAFTKGGFDSLADLPPFPEALRPNDNRKREERFHPAGQPGDDPHAEPWVLATALEAVTTPGAFKPWNNVAMAIWRATEGSAEGFQVFDDWSRRGANYGGTYERWDALDGSPPNSIGAGTIFHMADEADPSWRERADAVDPEWRHRGVVESMQRNIARVADFFATEKGKQVAIRIEGFFSTSPPKAVTQLDAKSLADFDGQPAPPRQWIVEGVIPDRNVTDLSGDGGTGKSILALQAGAAMATNTAWLGFPVVPGRVLYMSCEDEMDEIRRRAEALCRQRDIRLGDLRNLFVVDMTLADGTELAALEKGRLALTAVFAGLEAKIEELRPKLVILDTRADVFAGNEIDRAQVRLFVKALRRLCFQYDLAVLMLSHPSLTGMNSGSGQSGSTAWGNSVRSRLYLERPKASDDSVVDSDLRVLSTKKANYGAADTEVALRYVGGEFVAQRDGTLSGLDQQARERMVEERFLALLKQFELQGRNVSSATSATYAPALFAASDGKIGKGQFRAAMERLFAARKIKVEQFGPPSKKRQRIVELTA
ncbi:AAA family ATPase [Mesorhizobium sp. M1136]|uniref:AAA family ATPase n=1 Tax=Mesorhizobium sp. M1136 TaxID=2957059 RepID=UPI00333542E0